MNMVGDVVAIWRDHEALHKNMPMERVTRSEKPWSGLYNCRLPNRYNHRDGDDWRILALSQATSRAREFFACASGRAQYNQQNVSRHSTRPFNSTSFYPFNSASTVSVMRRIVVLQSRHDPPTIDCLVVCRRFTACPTNPRYER